MPASSGKAHEHIQKSRNFPGHLLKAIEQGHELGNPDLHGYRCDEARDLMWQAFRNALPHDVAYSFVIGCGRHSMEKYSVELQKACAQGLREAGLAENRHASTGAMGEFKLINDRDQGIKMVKVFPHRSTESSGGGRPTAEVSDTDDEYDVAQARLRTLMARCEPAHLANSSTLGLAELLSDLLPVVLQCTAYKRLGNGEMPSVIQEIAREHTKCIGQGWNLAVDCLREDLKDFVGIYADARKACLAFVEEMEQSNLIPKEKVDELRNLVNESATCKSLPSEHKDSRLKLRSFEQQLAKLDIVLEKWTRGRHKFQSVQEQTDALRRAEHFRVQIMEIESTLWNAARERVEPRNIPELKRNARADEQQEAQTKTETAAQMRMRLEVETRAKISVEMKAKAEEEAVVIEVVAETWVTDEEVIAKATKHKSRQKSATRGKSARCTAKEEAAIHKVKTGTKEAQQHDHGSVIVKEESEISEAKQFGITRVSSLGREWTQYQYAFGRWWSCELEQGKQDWFLEQRPTPWAVYKTPAGNYWWHNAKSEEWFYA
jgi:hypothetical protein